MIDKAYDPFWADEMPSQGYVSNLIWERGLYDISTNVSDILFNFLDQVCEKYLTGIDLVAAWITIVRRNRDITQTQLQFPTTADGSPVFPIIVDVMLLEPAIKQAALAFYEIADPNYHPKPF